jgi:maltose/moltooligosaccharide transporter
VIAPAGLLWLFWHPTGATNFYLWILVMVVLSAPAGALNNMYDPPMFMRVFPRDRYGQYCSANALLRSFAAIVTGMAVGVYLDKLKDLFGEKTAYFCLPFWSMIFYVPMLVFMILLYRGWKRQGGDEHYVAPGLGS